MRRVWITPRVRCVCVHVLGQHHGVISVKAFVSDRVVSVLEEMTSRLNRSWEELLCLLGVPPQVELTAHTGPEHRAKWGSATPAASACRVIALPALPVGREVLPGFL